VNFLFPLFTIAGLCIAIPIVIHLFNFRKYKKVLFPDIRFLKELQEQTQRHSTLKHLLVLASRILAILALVLAFAQPFFSNKNNTITRGPKAVSIYIDNSNSMSIQQNGISILDNAKAKAREIIDAYSSDDKFQLLTNDYARNQHKFLNKEEALAYIPQIQASSKSRTADEILEKQHQLLNTENESTKQLVYISDFQKNSFTTNTICNDTCKKYFIPLIPTTVNNIILDTCYFETPTLQLNNANKLVFKLKNNADEEVNTAVTLIVNKQLKNVVNTVLKANQVKTDSITFTPTKAGYQNIELFINDYPVSYDDTLFMSAKVTGSYSVLIVNQSNANAFLNNVFRPNALFRVDNTFATNVNASTLSNYSLVILNGITALPTTTSDALANYVNAGGNILCFAPIQNNTSAINLFLQKTCSSNYSTLDTARLSVSNFSKEHELFRDMFTKIPDNIDLPIANKHYTISSSSIGSQQKLFTFDNGDAFLSSYRVGGGKMYVCASSADMQASSFPTSYWFLPLIYKMAFLKETNELNFATLGSNKAISIQNKTITDKTIYHIANKNNDAIPQQRNVGNQTNIYINNAVQEAGIYSIYLPTSTDTIFAGLNYSRKESELNYWNILELKTKTAVKNIEWIDEKSNVGHAINEIQHGTPLWKICILLALLFLLIEIALIKFFK
jgi:hypothetical protein